MKKYIFLILALVLNIQSYSHPWKPRNYVIIDTDGGIDDMRAITMLLASPDVRVLGIIASPGVLSAENSYLKVKSLLNSFFHEGIPVGINRDCKFKSPEFKYALNTKWGNEDILSAKDALDYVELIRNLFAAEKASVKFISLGGLTSVRSASEQIPSFSQQVKEIVWSSGGLSDLKGFNYNIDSKSAVSILNGKMPVRIVKAKEASLFYDDDFIKEFKKINNDYAQEIADFFTKGIADEHEFAKEINDELVPLFLHYPQLFNSNPAGINSESYPSDVSALKDKILTILKGETIPRNQVVKTFPDDPSFYYDDLKDYVAEIIGKYGQDEWISGIIANELHRHLGVFAIIGVKMGIRAREYFNTGVDEFKVTSYAGSTPPISCFNDGLQVSTGATPGHGLLTVVSETPVKPVAEFNYIHGKIRVSLKPEITKKVSDELKEINFVYGLDSDIYWELVRKNSIKYWLSLDRHEIFDIEEIK